MEPITARDARITVRAQVADMHTVRIVQEVKAETHLHGIRNPTILKVMFEARQSEVLQRVKEAVRVRATTVQDQGLEAEALVNKSNHNQKHFIHGFFNE